MVIEGPDAGRELLAGAGFAFEQHRDVAVGRELEHREGLAQHEALAHQLAAPPRPRRRHLQRPDLSRQRAHRAYPTPIP